MHRKLALVTAVTILAPTAETFSTAVPPPTVTANEAMSWLSTTAPASNYAASVGNERPFLRMTASNDADAVVGVDDLRGKVAVVTGSSRGIGKGIAVTLGERGCTVYVTGRSAGGTSTDQACKAEGFEFCIFHDRASS